jgi:hypothetical protein
LFEQLKQRVLSSTLLTPVRTMLLTPDEWTTLNNIVLTTFISSMFHQPCWRLFCHVATTVVCSSSVNNVVGTKLLTIVAWTALFSYDNNIVQALFNEQRRTTLSIFTRVAVPFQNQNRLNIGRQISLAIYIRDIFWYYRNSRIWLMMMTS